MRPILQKEAPILREKAQDVPLDKITSPKIQRIIAEMKVALESQDDGVAIAAPQVGYSLCIFVVSHRVAKIRAESRTQPKRSINRDKAQARAALATTATNLLEQDSIFINPVIKKLSKEKKLVEEGCLSVRYLYGKVKRANKAVILAYDENGKKFSRGASGLLSQIFQHEIDHLSGILFTDKAKHVEEILPPVVEVCLAPKGQKN